MQAQRHIGGKGSIFCITVYSLASNFLKYPRRNGFNSSAVVPFVANFFLVAYVSMAACETSESGIRR